MKSFFHLTFDQAVNILSLLEWIDEFLSCFRQEKQKEQVESAGKDEIKKRVSDMNAFLKEQPTLITEYDEALVRRLIEKVGILDDKFTVAFKSGLAVDIKG